jgi:hypothetical protein
MLFLFTGVSYKQDPYFAHAVQEDIDCIEEMLQNSTLDCSNADTLSTKTDSFSTTADPCTNITTWIDLARIPLNETRQSLEIENITAAMNNLKITDRMLEQLKNASVQGDITLSNITLPFLPLGDVCNIESELELIRIPLNETRQSLEIENITAAMNNLKITDRMLERLIYTLEIIQLEQEYQPIIEELEEEEATAAEE